MAPAKWELADKRPFTGFSGRILDDTLAFHKVSRASVRITNLCSFYIDDNNLYSVPQEIMETERLRVFREIEETAPNILLILGGDTLDLLTATKIVTTKKGELATVGSKSGVTKWRGSIFTLVLPSGRQQKCLVAMHPANFIRGQWKWLPVWKYIDVARAVTQSSFPEIHQKQRTSIIGPSFQEANQYLLTALDQKEVTIDYEGREFITCLGIGWSSSEAICIPLNRVGSATYWSLEEESILWKLWCQLLESPQVKKNAQNAAFEWMKSWLHGIYPNPLGIDTMLLHHCLYPDFGGITDEWSRKKRDIDNPGHGLAFLVSQYTDHPFYKDDGRHWTPAQGEQAFWNYNCLDVMLTHEIAGKLREEAAAAGLMEVYERNYNGTLENSLRMEWYGILQDLDKRERVKSASLADIATRLDTLSDALKLKVITKAGKGQKPAPGTLNLASPKQMLDFIVRIKKYKAGVKRRTGAITVDKDTLNALAIKHDDDHLRQIIKIREIQDFVNDWCNPKVDTNGYLHSHFKIGGTNGTRWSSTESILGSGTNIQNPPRQGPARSFFLPT